MSDKDMAILKMIDFIKMQLKREKGIFHIPSKTARKILAETIKFSRRAIR